MYNYGSMHTDSESIHACFADYILDEISILNSTVFWNDTHGVVGLNLLYSTGETRRYGNITYAQY